MINKLHKYDFVEKSHLEVNRAGFSKRAGGDQETDSDAKGYGGQTMFHPFDEWHNSGHEHGDCNHYGASVIVFK